MPPSIFCPDTTWTGTQILLSEQHWTITDLVIDLIGLKVLDEGEWKVRKHGANLESNDLY